ncbi:MAG: N-acetylmuramoyl-L-alanine amidase family protein [Lachnospirales bacterium]
MSKYLALYSQDKYRFELYDNTRRLTRQQIQKETGCYALVNLWLFSLADQPKCGVKYWDHQNGGVMLRGKWEYEKYDYPGICIDKDGRLTTGGKSDAAWDYAACANAGYIGGKRGAVTPYPRNGLTYTGLTPTGDVVILLATKDTPMTGDEAMEALHNAGCVDILRWDGSWSSQGYLGPGMDAQPSQKRLVRGYLLIYKRDDQNKEDKPVGKKVCLDPGHGPDTVNGSPDGTYKEREFTWDMYRRLRPLLEAQGVEVICTRAENEKPSLTARAAVSNKAGADLFVSLHSNASGNGWTAPKGFVIYTSVAGDSAGRNKAAKAILVRMKEAGVTLFGSGLEHNPEYTVLRATTAPAMIVEHGFHTNREDTALLKDSAYRGRLARAEARGICDYLGVAWKDGPGKEEMKIYNWVKDMPAWAQESAAKAIRKGIIKMDDSGAVNVYECNLQPLVWMDRAGLI